MGLQTDTKTKLRLKNNRNKTHFKRPTGNPDNRIMTAVKPVVTLELFIFTNCCASAAWASRGWFVQVSENCLRGTKFAASVRSAYS